MSETPNERPDPMTRIEVKLTKIGTDLGHIKAKVVKIDETLQGNGDVGIVLRVDRNTRSLKDFRKLFWVAVVALVTLAATAGWDAIRENGYAQEQVLGRSDADDHAEGPDRGQGGQ